MVLTRKPAFIWWKLCEQNSCWSQLDKDEVAMTMDMLDVGHCSGDVLCSSTWSSLLPPGLMGSYWGCAPVNLFRGTEDLLENHCSQNVVHSLDHELDKLRFSLPDIGPGYLPLKRTFPTLFMLPATPPPPPYYSWCSIVSRCVNVLASWLFA